MGRARSDNSRIRRWAGLYKACVRGLLTSLALAAPLSAQVPGPTVTVIGLVVDSVSGAPITAARVSLVIGGPGVASDALGRFALPNVPVGTRRIFVSRLGYQDLEPIIQITDPMGGVRFRMSPDPVQIEGVTSGGRSDDIRGRVVDADSGEPVPYAVLTLTKDGVRKLGRRFRSTDTLGNFVLPDVSEGPYVLRVERPGYAIRLQQIAHTGDGNPFLITLQYDARRVAALNALRAQLDARVNVAPKADVITEQKLQTAVMATDFERFLMFEGPLGWGLEPESDVLGRLGPRDGHPRLYVDGVYQQPSIGYYATFSPKEFYRVDFLECRNPGVIVPPLRPGQALLSIGFVRVIVAYTYAYIEDRMANPNKRDPKDRELELCFPVPR